MRIRRIADLCVGRQRFNKVIIALTIFGLVILVAGSVGSCYLFCSFRDRRLASTWLVAEVIALTGGIGLGVTLLTIDYHYSATVRLVGFPFLAAVFELYNGHWDDYVGPLTLPAAVGNFLVGLLVPQMILAAVVWKQSRRSRDG